MKTLPILVALVLLASTCMAQTGFELANAQDGQSDGMYRFAGLPGDIAPEPTQTSKFGHTSFGHATSVELFGLNGPLFDGDTIAAWPFWDFSDRIERAITISGGTIIDVSVFNSNGEVFDAELSNGAVDFTLDRAILRLLPPGTIPPADLFVATDGGNFNFTVFVVPIPPEPGTVSMIGVAMLCCSAHRQRRRAASRC